MKEDILDIIKSIKDSVQDSNEIYGSLDDIENALILYEQLSDVLDEILLKFDDCTAFIDKDLKIASNADWISEDEVLAYKSFLKRWNSIKRYYL